MSTAEDSTTRFALTVVISGIAAALVGAAIGIAAVTASGSDAPMWVFARATGVTSYLLLTLITITGLLLAHPNRAQWRFLTPATQLRSHVGLTVFTLVFTLLHIVVLAIDPWAKVGWAGAFLPMAAEYRPVAVSLGVISLWAGVIAGVTAGMSGRVVGRWWRPLHRLAALAWILAWLHAVFAGSDTAGLMVMYAVTGLAVIVTATWRYASPNLRTSPERPRATEVSSR